MLITKKTVFEVDGRQFDRLLEAEAYLENAAAEVLLKIFRKHRVPHSAHVACVDDILAAKTRLARLFAATYEGDED